MGQHSSETSQYWDIGGYGEGAGKDCRTEGVFQGVGMGGNSDRGGSDEGA
jgi:hypothetical protein